MSFLNSACDNPLRVKLFAGSVAVLLAFPLLSGCISQTERQVLPATTRVSEPDETLQSGKPVPPPVIPKSDASAERTSSQEIEVHDPLQNDSPPIESE
jgi:hypothetical protein